MPQNTPAGSGIILPTRGTHSEKTIFSSFLGPSYPAGSLGPWYPAGSLGTWYPAGSLGTPMLTTGAVAGGEALGIRNLSQNLVCP